MARFFLEPESWTGAAALSGDEATHCARVMRAKAGDQIEVFDGCGRSAPAEVHSISKRRVELRLGEVSEEARPRVEVILAQSVVKGKAMDLLLRKAVELGVTAIQPVLTENGVVKMDAERPEKWPRAALEACKQCGRNWIPEVLPVLKLNDFLQRPDWGERIVASLEPGALSLRERLRAMENPQKITVLVGPEGDFTGDEMRLCGERGFLPAHFGPAVLRSETAALFCLAAISYEFLNSMH